MNSAGLSSAKEMQRVSTSQYVKRHMIKVPLKSKLGCLFLIARGPEKNPKRTDRPNKRIADQD